MTQHLTLTTDSGVRVAEVLSYNHASGQVLVRITPDGIPVRLRMSELAIGRDVELGKAA